MSFINAVVCGGPGVHMEFRMHIRYELINQGLLTLIDVNPELLYDKSCVAFFTNLYFL
jgi:hypothetical protein